MGGLSDLVIAPLLRLPVRAAAPLLVAIVLAGCGAAPGLQVEHESARGSPSALPSATHPASKCKTGRRAAALGEAAFVDRGALKLALVARCSTKAITLVAHGAEGPVRFSADGRWVAYGDGMVASVDEGEILRPLGQKLLTWAWVGDGDELAGITEGGGVVAGAPGRPPTMLLPDGWDATSLVAGSGGEIAISRAAPHPRGRVVGSASIWMLTLSRRKPFRSYQAPPGTAELTLARFAPGGKDLVFWVNKWGSASLAEDGLPLELASVQHRSPPVMLSTGSPTRPEAVVACGDRLLFLVGASREATLEEHLEIADAADGWQARDLADGARAATSPSCSPNGEAIAAATGPNRASRPGAEHRSIELLTGRRVRLTIPPRGSTDESPRFAGGGGLVLFIRSAHGDGGARGVAYLISTHSPGAKPIGPLFTAGPGSDYYGSYDWGEIVAFHAGGRGAAPGPQ